MSIDLDELREGDPSRAAVSIGVAHAPYQRIKCVHTQRCRGDLCRTHPRWAGLCSGRWCARDKLRPAPVDGEGAVDVDDRRAHSFLACVGRFGHVDLRSRAVRLSS
jgi:hypothetical protein